MYVQSTCWQGDSPVTGLWRGILAAWGGREAQHHHHAFHPFISSVLATEGIL